MKLKIPDFKTIDRRKKSGAGRAQGAPADSDAGLSGTGPSAAAGGAPAYPDGYAGAGEYEGYDAPADGTPADGEAPFGGRAVPGGQAAPGGRGAGPDGAASSRGTGPVARRAGTVRGMLTGYALWAAVILAVSVLLELFMFNYNHWHTPRGGEMTAGNYAASPLDAGGAGTGSGEGGGASPHDGGSSGSRGESSSGSPDSVDPGSAAPGSGGFTVSFGSGLEQTQYGTFLITNPDRAYLTLSDINAPVHNIYLHLIDPASPAVYYTLQFTDSANGNLRELDEKAVVSGVPESRYVQLHLSGTTRRLRLRINAQAGEEVHIRQIRLNVEEPLFVHPGRIAFLWLIGMLLVLFGPRSWVYTTRLDLREGRQRLLVVAIVLLNIVATSWAGRAADPSVWRELRDDRDYQEKEYELYAEALLQGHTYLDIRPPRYLVQMRNPYDRMQRNEVAGQNDEKVLWDAAYYNGRYYVYFGIVPALLSFLPWRVLTGAALPTWRAVLFNAGLLWILAFYFLYVLIRRYFKKTSLGIYLLLSWAFVPACGVIYLATFPVVYSVPFIYGLVFTILGLSLWMRGFDKKGKAHRLRMAAGSLCIALTLGCRPTMILTALLAFPVFWEEIREKKFFFPKRESLRNTAAVILPFVPVGLVQMELNRARFGSPFDFGADYNLTVTDLTKKTFSIAKNIPALFQELVQPLHIQPQFPFITGIEVATDYQGYMFIDKMLGGFFALNLLALFCFWIFRIRKKMADRRVFGLAAFAFGLAAVLIEMDIQIGGISQRYMIDYGWLLMLAAVLAILTILDDADTYGYYAYLKVVIVLAALCIGVNYLTVFSDGQAISVRTYNPELFYRIRYLLLPS